MKKEIKKIKQLRRTMLRLLVVIVLILAVLLAVFVVGQQRQANTTPPILQDDFYGVLVLGSDAGATRTNGGDHTDSITYVAINKKTQKGYALPIYRDAFINNQCTQTAVNINHIYRDSGIDCLLQSVRDVLQLPVNYYVYITSNGFVDVFNRLGPVELVPEASYCSDYGNDEREYCFTVGRKETLNGNALLAYARYRGPTSGEQRANRHVQILNKAYEMCFADKSACAGVIMDEIARQDIRTNLPYEAVFSFDIFVHLETLDTIAGSNFEDANGWHQRLDEADLQAKTSLIRREIFSE